MAYFSLHAYDADVWIPAFLGLNQADTGMNPDVRFAADCANMETPNGALQPMAAPVLYDGSFASRVETLASFTRRWYQGDGKNEWYVLCAGGKLYQKQAGSSAEWDAVTLPSGITAYECSTWSCVTYEINEQGSDNPIDVLLMSNAQDGMIMLVPPERPTTYGDLEEFTHLTMKAYTHLELHSPKWTIRTVDTQGKKFGVIERYAERIWGGALPEDPDTLMYSRPFDPTDWTAAGPTEEPEDGAGDVMQPTWDGDRFHALKAFGNQLIAFKKNRVWRIMGTDPGEYTFKEQFGGGTPYFSTIAADTERILMADRDGMEIYDGLSVAPYRHEIVETLWRTVNRDALDQMCGALFQNRYYLAFPTGDSTVNNALLIYDMDAGTVLSYEGISIEAFMPTEDELFMTTSTLPGKIMTLKYDSWAENVSACCAPARWVTPWIDFGYKRINKGGFDLYFVPEVKDTAVELKISVQTEKKLKTKRYTVNPLTAEQRTAGKEHRGKRLHFGGSGRKFRVIIETEAGTTAPWRLIGGIQLVVETDPD